MLGLPQQVATVAEPLGMQGWQLVDELSRAFACQPPSLFGAPPMLITPQVLQGADELSSELDVSYEDVYLRRWRQMD